MIEGVEITIRIPSDAQSRAESPYVEHPQFIKFCNANKADIKECELELYEKNGLFYPCFRIYYPRELLRRDFRVRREIHKNKYKINRECEPLIDLDNLLSQSPHWGYKEFDESIEYGHPLEQAFKRKNPFIVKPEMQRFKSWSRYKVIVGKYDNRQIRESRVKHYYSPWKIFILYDLKRLNTDEYNRITGLKRGWGILTDRLKQKSSLTEFSPFFMIISSFAYRQSLLTTYYFVKTQKRQQDWNLIRRRKKQFAQDLFSAYSYSQWIHFLRKMIETYELYRDNENILLSLEAKAYINRIVIFLLFATGYNFKRICGDVSGKYKGRFGVGLENGVRVYPGRLEEMFPDEKWDLEQNVRWLLNNEIKQFNSLLSHGAKFPESLADGLFDELSKEHIGTALAAIRKINKTYFGQEIWRENEVWSGVRDLAVSIEVHGKQWIGGNKLNDVLTSLFPSLYDVLKKKIGIPRPTDAGNTAEFLNKIKVIHKKLIPANERCGGHLVIAHLTRNFSNHQKGLFGKELQENLPLIYSALIRTLFVLYAQYKRI